MRHSLSNSTHTRDSRECRTLMWMIVDFVSAGISASQYISHDLWRKKTNS